jgi:protein associated with RNAse G/E
MQIRVNSRKYDGTIGRTWICELFEQCGSLIVVRGVFDRDVEHPQLGHINHGTTSYEFYWLDRWFSIFRFFEPDGRFRNYYCNVNMPPTFMSSVIDYIDLDLDVIVWPDGRFVTIDRDEFEENKIRFSYPKNIIDEAENALGNILHLIDSGRLVSEGKIQQLPDRPIVCL